MGRPVPLVVRVEDLESRAVKEYAFLKSPVRVGRSEINDLHLEQGYVSTWHGLVQFEDEKITFVDLGSTNGTTLDGARLDKNAPVEIRPGADLRIGALKLTLARREAGAAAAVPRRATAFAMRAAQPAAPAGPARVAPGPQQGPPAAGAKVPDAKSPSGVKFVRPVPGAGPVGRLSGVFSAPVVPAQPAPAAAPPPSAAPASAAPARAVPLAAAPVAPAAPAAIPPPSIPGQDPARQAVEDAAWQLQVLQDGIAEARRAYDEAAEAVILRVPEAERARCRALLAEKHGSAPAAPPAGAAPAPFLGPGVDIFGEPIPGFAPQEAPAATPLAPAPGGADAFFAPPAAVDPAGSEALSLLRAFAETYLAAGAPLDGTDQVRALLDSVADVLETSARSYIELRRGYEEFGKEMGIRVAQGDGPVARARDTRQLLAWLLARSDEPRAPELASAFADLMIHQVALLNGVTEGAKSLLAQLSPEAISETLEKEGGAARLALGVKALREGAQWRAYLDRYQELTEEDAALTDVLFGKDFARAYSAVAGRRSPSAETPEPERPATPRPGPARRDR